MQYFGSALQNEWGKAQGGLTLLRKLSFLTAYYLPELPPQFGHFDSGLRASDSARVLDSRSVLAEWDAPSWSRPLDARGNAKPVSRLAACQPNTGPPFSPALIARQHQCEVGRMTVPIGKSEGL